MRRKVAIPVDRGHGGERGQGSASVHHRLGPANAITAVRAVLTLVLAVLVVRDAPVGVIVALAAVALVTDAVDGRVARRTGTVSRFGARFDMETDAALLLVLSLYVARDLGLWVLAIGLARYVFLAAKVPLPWLRGQAPPRPWCKVVAALQGVVLVVAASGLLPVAVTTGALLVSPRPADRVVRPRGLGPLAAAPAAPPPTVGDPADRAARVPGGLGRAGRARRDRRALPRGLRPDPARGPGAGRPGAPPARPAGRLAGHRRRPACSARSPCSSCSTSASRSPSPAASTRSATRCTSAPGCRSCATPSARPTPTPSPFSPCC